MGNTINNNAHNNSGLAGATSTSIIMQGGAK